MKTSKFRLLKILAGLLLFAIWGLRAAWLNQQWPAAEIVLIPIGEVWQTEKAAYQAVELYAGDPEKIIERYAPQISREKTAQIINEQKESSQKELEFLCLVLRVQNQTNEPLYGVELPMQASNGAWNNGCTGADWLSKLNPQLKEPLLPNESREYRLLFSLNQESFSKKDWAHRKERNFCFPLQYYPKQIQFEGSAVWLEKQQEILTKTN